jgi:hypothetical protein
MWHWQPVRQNGSARHCRSVGAPVGEGVAIAGGGLAGQLSVATATETVLLSTTLLCQFEMTAAIRAARLLS